MAAGDLYIVTLLFCGPAYDHLPPSSCVGFARGLQTNVGRAAHPNTFCQQQTTQHHVLTTPVRVCSSPRSSASFTPTCASNRASSTEPRGVSLRSRAPVGWLPGCALLRCSSHYLSDLQSQTARVRGAHFSQKSPVRSCDPARNKKKQRILTSTGFQQVPEIFARVTHLLPRARAQKARRTDEYNAQTRKGEETPHHTNAKETRATMSHSPTTHTRVRRGKKPGAGAPRVTESYPP